MNLAMTIDLKKTNHFIGPRPVMEKISRNLVFINIKDTREAYHVVCDIYLTTGKYVGFDVVSCNIMNETDAYNASVIITKNEKGEFKKWVSTTMTCRAEH